MSKENNMKIKTAPCTTILRCRISPWVPNS
uniref:Uncharacterized protein n=1 Tax=Rhizophora mucronata TaxID=61149 RepID=A0A2P2Q450_RHIMU